MAGVRSLSTVCVLDVSPPPPIPPSLPFSLPQDDKLEMMLDEFNAEQARQPPASGVGLGGGKLGEGIGTVTMLSGSDRYAWSDTMTAGSDGGPPRGPRSSSLPVPVTQQR